jgi:hypothetical protein
MPDWRRAGSAPFSRSWGRPNDKHGGTGVSPAIAPAPGGLPGSLGKTVGVYMDRAEAAGMGITPSQRPPKFHAGSCPGEQEGSAGKLVQTPRVRSDELLVTHFTPRPESLAVRSLNLVLKDWRPLMIRADGVDYRIPESLVDGQLLATVPASLGRTQPFEAFHYSSLSFWLQADRDRALEHTERSLALWAGLDHPAGRARRATRSAGIPSSRAPTRRRCRTTSGHWCYSYKPETGRTRPSPATTSDWPTTHSDNTKRRPTTTDTVCG